MLPDRTYFFFCSPRSPPLTLSRPPLSQPLSRLSSTPKPPSRLKIYVYYELTDFFQNHKRYGRSRDDNPMGGGGAATEPCSSIDSS